MSKFRPVVVSLGIVMVLLQGCGKPPPSTPIRPVRTMTVGDASALEGRVFPGKAKATQEVNLSFRVGGPLIARPIDVGTVVEQGQTLARIDPRDFEVELRNVQAQLESAKATYTLSVDEYERARDAHGQGAVSDIELSRKLSARDSAKAQVDSLIAAVDSASDALQYTTLAAPFVGEIVAIFVENFEDVQQKQPIARLLDDSRIEMVIEIPEQMISMHPYVTDVQCRFDAFPDQPVPATIKEVGTEASTTTRTFPVTLIMDQPEGFRILPGMTGEAAGRLALPAELVRDGIEIPVSAVASTEGSTSHVWLVDEASSTVRRRDVTLGALTSTGITVTGVEQGERIATAGVHYLAEGQQVRIVEEAVGESAP